MGAGLLAGRGWVHFWQIHSFPLNVTRSPAGNGCLQTNTKQIEHQTRALTDLVCAPQSSQMYSKPLKQDLDHQRTQLLQLAQQEGFTADRLVKSSHT